MAARRKKATRRRKPAFSFLNALEAYTYGSIMSQNLFGTSPWGFITGEGDISYDPYHSGWGGVTGVDEISLSDIIKEPGHALDAAGKNLQNNLLPMALQSLMVGVSFRIGRRLLSRPISNINRNIMKPLLGKGVRV